MSTVIVSTGTVANATGRPAQSHLVYCVNTACWLAFYLDSTDTSKLKVKYNTNADPTAGSWLDPTTPTFTLANAHGSHGRHFAFVYKNISTTDVVHITISYQVTTTNHISAHLRMTFSGTTATWGTEAQLATDATSLDYGTAEAATAAGINSANTIFDSEFARAGANIGNLEATQSTNTDAGSSWTAGFAAGSDLGSGNAGGTSQAFADLGSAKMVMMGDNSRTTGTWNNLQSFVYNAGWSGNTNILGASPLGANADTNDWTTVTMVAGTIFVFWRIDATTYGWAKTTDGSTWTTPTGAIPSQASKAGGGLFAASDGTDLWLFVISSVAGNAVRYCKYTTGTTSWGSWTDLDATSQVRTCLSGYGLKVGSVIAVIWSQTNGSNFDYTVSSLGGSVAPSPPLRPMLILPETTLHEDW